jgi:hypothetical protein
MEYEGMVHALEELHRLLKPDGVLIDIHPVPMWSFIKVYRRGEVLFEEMLPETYWEDVNRAERALAEVVEGGLFVVEMADKFDFLTYASSVGELRAYRELMDAFDDSPKDEAAVLREEELAAQVETILRKSGKGAEVAIHERGRMARMRPVK